MYIINVFILQNSTNKSTKTKYKAQKLIIKLPVFLFLCQYALFVLTLKDIFSFSMLAY